MPKRRKKLLAFHGDATLKRRLVAEIKRHMKADQIVKGTYGDHCDVESFRGCAVGCSIHSLCVIDGKIRDTSSHELYEPEFGIPSELAWLEDGIFEGLPIEQATKFPLQFIQAINVGADLSRIVHDFFAWLLDDPQDGVIRFADEAGKIAIKRVADLHRRKRVKESEWSAARSAARAAGAAARSAARSAAWAAAWAAAMAAARSAARSAAGAAAGAVAWDAERAAAWAAAWDAAWAAAWAAQCKKLLSLLRAAK